MKFLKITLLILSVVSLTNIVSAQTKGEYKLIDVPSPSLKKAIIEAKEQQKVGIYLPPSYNESKKSYPVVYFLTGFTVHPGEFPPTRWIDSIMSNGLVQEMIYVEISGHNMLEGTMYANSPITGNWEDFVTIDVIAFIDKNYRTLAKRESRGIAGHSMGGAGTINISLKHADKYAVAYPMSPAISVKDSLMENMFSGGNAFKTMKRLSKKLKDVLNDKFGERLKKEIASLDWQIYWLLANGFAFSPDLSQPLKMTMPCYFSEDGKLMKNEKSWKQWELGLGSLDKKVAKYKDNLLKYRHYAIDCGYQDENIWIYDGTKYLSNLLTNNEIPHSMHLYEGDHISGVDDQLVNKVMPVMSAYLEME